MEPQFRFVHIPKTAGITFSLVLLRQFRGQRKLPVYLPEQRKFFLEHEEKVRNDYDLVFGHYPFPANSDSSVNYFTFLRNPEDRLLSRYKHFRERRRGADKQRDTDRYNLKDFLESGVIKNVDNCMTRFLSGNTEKPFGAINEEDLKKAIDNLDHHFPVFGITERFDESLVLLSRKLKWPLLLYARENSSAYKVDAKEFDEETRRLLRLRNFYDEQLYAYACEKFKRMMMHDRDLVEEEVKMLKAKNKKYKLFLLARNKANLLAARLLKLIN